MVSQRAKRQHQQYREVSLCALLVREPYQASCVAYLAVAGGLFGLPFTAGQAMAGPCTGPGAPTTFETKCVTGIFIPGNPLRSFDISWVNPKRGSVPGDRSNSGIDVIDTDTLMWKRTIGGFVGIKLNGQEPP